MKLSQAFVGKTTLSVAAAKQLLQLRQQGKDEEFNKKLIAQLDAGGVWGVQQCSLEKAMAEVCLELTQLTAPEYVADVHEELCDLTISLGANAIPTPTAGPRYSSCHLAQNLARTYQLQSCLAQIKPILAAARAQKTICLKLLCADNTAAAMFFYQDQHELTLELVRNLTLDLNSQAGGRKSSGGKRAR